MAETTAQINDRLRSARSAITEAFIAHESSMGPASDPDLMEMFVQTADEPCDVPGSMLVAEWVAVVAWVDVESGLTWTTRIRSENMPHHHMVGLLHGAMD
jgi:hypothetical protein